MDSVSEASEVNRSRTNRPKRNSTETRSGGVRDKKKAQNKAAQRNFREKRQSHLQYLESFVEAVKSTQDDRNSNYGHHQLLRAHLELLEDYRQLHESFIKLRNKLQSIGQAALSAADDDALDRVERAAAKHNGSQGDAKEKEKLSTSSGTQVQRSEIDSLFRQPASSNSELGLLSQNRNSVEQHIDPVAVSQNIANVEGMTISWPFLPSDVHYSLGNNFILVSSKSVFADKVEEACKQYLYQVNQSPTRSKDHGAFLAFPQLRIESNLTSAAIRLINELSGLESFIYGSDFHEYLERILMWRLCNTLESKSALSEPFQPTPLQYSLMNYPVIIDFLPWPSIRDQLILSRHNIDLDVVCRELTLHTVVELPEKGIAMRVYDALVHNAINNRFSNDYKSPSCLNCPDWYYIELNPESPYNENFDPVQAMIVAELGHRLSQLDKQPCVTAPSFTRLREQPYDIDPRVFQVRNWKLDREFPKNWTLLDCSQAVSRYATVLTHN